MAYKWMRIAPPACLPKFALRDNVMKQLPLVVVIIVLRLVLITHGTDKYVSCAEPQASSAVEPAQPEGFAHAGIIDAWKNYADVLTFGRGQTLALLDDGCTMSRPEWKAVVDGVPKVRVAYDAMDGDDDPKHEGKGYHGTTIGIPS